MAGIDGSITDGWSDCGIRKCRDTDGDLFLLNQEIQPASFDVARDSGLRLKNQSEPVLLLKSVETRMNLRYYALIAN